MRNIFLVILAVLVGGCISVKKYEKIVDAWVGKDIDELVEGWGPPTSTYNLNNGKKMYTWHYSNGQVAYTSTLFNGLMTTSGSYWCKTTFTADQKGTIERWQHEGNNCTANNEAPGRSYKQEKFSIRPKSEKPAVR